MGGHKCSSGLYGARGAKRRSIKTLLSFGRSIILSGIK
jgi:hypothetical protein